MDSALRPETVTIPSSLISTLAPDFSQISLMTLPPESIIAPILSGLIVIVSRDGAFSLNFSRDDVRAFAP